jgi:SAM-dependent methyltransferase
VDLGFFSCQNGHNLLIIRLHRKLHMKLDRHLLVRLFGIRGALLHGDAMVADRWRFLKQRLPETRNGERLLDVGCGSGAFTIGAAKRGYRAMGLSWDEHNQRTAKDRALICGVPGAEFPIQDLRQLDQRTELANSFNVIVNFENIEHILDDRKLMRDIVKCLVPGGRLIMTTPFYYFRPLSDHDKGPYSVTEDGGHVRRGYSVGMLQELSADAGLIVEEIRTISGFFSQKIARFERAFGRAGWLVSLPFRILQPLLDGAIARVTGYRGYSICMVAYKPRFPATQ